MMGFYILESSPIENFLRCIWRAINKAKNKIKDKRVFMKICSEELSNRITYPDLFYEIYKKKIEIIKEAKILKEKKERINFCKDRGLTLLDIEEGGVC